MIRELREDEYELACRLMKSVYFLPRRKWTKPLHEMAIDGLTNHIYTAMGNFNKNGELCAYLDFKSCSPDLEEVGIGFTVEAFRGQGKMKELLRALHLRCPGKDIVVGTSENNKALLSAAHAVGFKEEEYIPNDRIDGTGSIHLRWKKADASVYPDVMLRPMQVGDLFGALQLWADTEGIVIREYDDSTESVEYFLSKNPGLSVVLESCGEIVGTLLCGNDGRRGYLYHFAVRNDFRHRGLGTLMLEKVLHNLQQEGIAKAALVAKKENQAGTHFWIKKGWVERTDLTFLDFPLCGAAF